MQPNLKEVTITTVVNPQHLITQDCYVRQLYVVCSDAGTAFKIILQAVTGGFRLLSWIGVVPTDGKPLQVTFDPNEWIFCKGGVDAITSGTPGRFDVAISYQQGIEP